MEFVRLQDHTELGPSKSTGQRVRSERLQSEYFVSTGRRTSPALHHLPHRPRSSSESSLSFSICWIVMLVYGEHFHELHVKMGFIVRPDKVVFMALAWFSKLKLERSSRKRGHARAHPSSTRVGLPMDLHHLRPSEAPTCRTALLPSVEAFQRLQLAS